MLWAMRIAEPRPPRLSYLRAGTFTLGAAAIHFSAAPMHLREYALFSAALLAIAVAQCALAAALALSPTRPVALAAVVSNLVVAVFWAVSRTVGLPIGPHPGLPEPAGLSDVTASLLELLAAAVLLISFAARLRSRRVHHPRAAMVFTVLVTLLLTVDGVAGEASATPLAVNMSAPVTPGHPAIPMDSLHEPAGDQPVKSFKLVAERGVIAGREAWTFNGVVPGPELRVQRGDRLRVTLVNRLPEATAIHWHGVRVPNAEDGVPGVTQEAVRPGASYTYEFVAKDAGSYFYHSHQAAVDQMSRGLFGALIIEPRAGSRADRDYAIVLHAMPNPGLEPGLLGFLPLFASPPPAFNGQPGDLHLQAGPGERVRLRVICAVEGEPDGALRINGVPQELVLLGAPYQVVAMDGHDLNRPQVMGPRRIRIGIGQRYDLVFVMPASGSVTLADARGKETVTLGYGPPSKAGDLGHLPLFDPLDYGTPSEDPLLSAGGLDATYRIVLGNGSGYLANQAEFVHSINGKVSPMMASFVVRMGQLVELHIINDTDEFHTMHLHGHWFALMAVNGRGLRGSPLHLDTLLVQPRQSLDTVFLADNPGLWMFHCHVLLHAALGMSAMISYENVITPYTFGSRSGNSPE